MAKIPIRHGTRIALDEREYENDARRPYLGMSSAGEECLRKLFYGFHWATARQKISAHTKRIFSIGHLFEEVIISELVDNGLEVFRLDPEGNSVPLTGKHDEQQEELFGYAGHEKGHCDGRILGVLEAPKTVHLLELKTMKQKYFTELQKKGVKEANFSYYCQCQRYMKEMKLNRTFFIAINKDTCELFIERFELDEGLAEDLSRKSRDIIMSYEPPPKNYIPGYYKCNYCQYNGVCHGEDKPDQNCRTCEHSDLEQDGVWICNNTKAIAMLSKGKCEDEMEINLKRQERGCKFYELGWSMKK